MTIEDKTLFVCNCNKTMPLDGAALGRALGMKTRAARAYDVCQRELAQFADGARGDLIVACTQEQRLLGDVAEEGGKRADDPLRQHPRDRRLVGRGGARDAEDRRAARDGRAAGPRAGAERRVQVRRPAADHRVRSTPRWAGPMHCSGRSP